MKKEDGFTLIELMVVVAIVAILAAIAYPSYRQYVLEARRTEAESALTNLASAMERFYSENLTYSGAANEDNSPTIFSPKTPIDGNETYYQLRITAADVNGYTLRANPVNAQAGDGFLQLRSDGRRAWDRDDNGTATGDENCWQDACN